MDHHALRGAQYPERFRRLWDTGQVVTAAGYLGLPDACLEARRRELWTARRKPPGRMGARGAGGALRRLPPSDTMAPRRTFGRAKGGGAR
jgi:hypothetical protein